MSAPTEFETADWPLHVTIVPPFETELEAEAVAELIPRMPPIPVAGAGRERFGSRRTVPVTVLRESAPLRGLHTQLVDALEAAGATLRDQRHLRGGFRAHATDQRSGVLHPGERTTITAVSVVARAPHGRRAVVARVALRP